MDFLDVFNISASGLTAERIRMQAVASNMANARTTRTPDGGPYLRQMPVFRAMPSAGARGFEQYLSEVVVEEIETSSEPPVLVYDPTHPDANGDGYVNYPNVNILEEMVDMLTTARSYEANTTAVEVTRQMCNTAIDIGRR
jgi:flagellar basal-body rod protein FlgC